MNHTIEILSSQEAKERPGIGSSIRKWEDIAQVMLLISNEAENNCGLCWEMLSKTPGNYVDWSGCKTTCLYKRCHDDGSDYTKTHDLIRKVRHAISDLIADLEVTRRQHESKAL
jgi:hypothetical protein